MQISQSWVMDLNLPSIIAAIVTLLFILLFQAFLVGIARNRAGANRKVVFLDLVVTADDESYSLSRLQIYLWTVVVMVSAAAVFAAKRKLPNIPLSLSLLMGLNLATAAASTAISGVKDKKLLFKGEPDFFKDIFFESEGSLDLPRTQMFGWTVISLIAFVVMFFNQFPDLIKPEIPTLPDMNSMFVALMGVSQGAYLGTKAATKN